MTFTYVCYGKLNSSSQPTLHKKKNKRKKYDDHINQCLIHEPSVFNKLNVVIRDKVQIDKTVHPSDLRNTCTFGLCTLIS